MRGLALCSLLLTGCELIASIPNASTNSPSDGGDDDVTDDADSDGPQGCTTSEQCTEEGARACLVSEGRCVQCLTGAECTVATEPVCAAQVCRGCSIDTDCNGGGVCLPTGACAATTRVLYAAPNGSGSTCSLVAPCAANQAVTLLAADKDVIKLAAGTYTVTPMSFASTAAPRFTMVGPGAALSATGNMFPQAFSVTGGAVLDVKGVDIVSGFSGASVQTSGKLSYFDSTITGVAIGLFANGGELNLERMVVRGATFYAVSGSSAVVNTRNSLLVNNGSAGSVTSIYLMQTTTGVLEHSTVANNLGDGVAGISCTDNTPSPAYAVRNTISFGNPATVTAACAVSYSNIEAGFAGANTNNVTLNPLFIDTTNYRLQATSPMRGGGDPANIVPVDIDGEGRPQPAGSPPDLGADEIP